MNDAAAAAYEADAADAAPKVGDNSMMALLVAVEDMQAKQAEVARIEELLKAAQEAARIAAEKTVPELMEELGIGENGVHLRDGIHVGVEEHINVGVSKENKNALHVWLRKIGLGGIIKKQVSYKFGAGADELAKKLIDAAKAGVPELTATTDEKVEPSTLKARIVARMREGKEVDDKIVNIHRRKLAVVTATE